jgi:hypothetical protein
MKVPGGRVLCGFNAQLSLRARGFPASWVIKLRIYTRQQRAIQVRAAWRTFCVHIINAAAMDRRVSGSRQMQNGAFAAPATSPETIGALGY